jgi:S-formylglutathione hydrolase FrmB
VAPLGLAVVMPQVHRSFYLDEVHGNRYWTFISAELPGIVGSFFRVSDRREDTFVAGLSMGGYGAMKWALREPWRFAAAASLSGALDLGARLPGGSHPLDPALAVQLFGERIKPADADDLLWLIRHGARTGMPALYVACGAEDSLYDENVRFVAACRARDVAVSVDFGPGEHEWGYWDARIQDVLRWLPLGAAA